MSQSRICILGGGFGGLYTAVGLSQMPRCAASPEITLIDQRDHFLFSPLLYELVTGELEPWEVAPAYSDLLVGTGINFRQAEVQQVNFDTAQVTLSTGAVLNYDRLVLALGNETPLDLVPGVVEYGLGFRTLADVRQLEQRLSALEASNRKQIRVVVVGAGYCGVELACKLADRLGKRGYMRLVELDRQILNRADPFNRAAAEQTLSRLGVWMNLETKVAYVGPDQIALDYKGQVDVLPADLVLWTVGNRITALVRQLPLAKNPRGQVLTKPTLQVLDYPQVYALGDMAECRDTQGQLVPSTAQGAYQQAACLTRNLWASLNNMPQEGFTYQHLGEMITLGIDKASVAVLGVELEGYVAQAARKLAYFSRLPTVRHQLRVGGAWLERPFQKLLTHR